MHKHIMAKAVERLTEATVGLDAGTTAQFTGRAVLQHEQVVFFTGVIDLTGKRGLRTHQPLLKPLQVIGQRSHTHQALLRQQVQRRKVTKTRGANDPLRHGRASLSVASARSRRISPSSTSSISTTRLGAKRSTSGPA